MTAALLVCILAVGLADSKHDIFGRPRPHGPEVNGAWVGLYTGRTRLLFGQPLVIEPFSQTGVGVGLPFRGRRSFHPVTLRVTDAGGRPVAYTLEPIHISSVTNGRLLPDPAHAVGGRFWKPGTYRVRLTVDWSADPGQPNFPAGRRETNELTVTVAEPGAAADDFGPTGEAATRVADAINRLSAGTPPDREAAARELTDEFGWDVLPAIQAALRTAPAEVASRLRPIIATHEDRTRRSLDSAGRNGQDAGLVMQYVWLAALPEPTRTRLLRRYHRAGASGRTALTVRLSEYAPIRVPQDRPLTPDEVEGLLDRLASHDPATRLLAARSVPIGAPAEVLRALVGLTADEYRETYQGPGDGAGPQPYLAPRAGIELARHGPLAVPLLIEAVEKSTHPFQRWVELAAFMGRVEPNQPSADYLQRRFRALSDNQDQELAAILEAWGRWGAAGVLPLADARPVIEEHQYKRRHLWRVATELGNTGHPSAVPALRTLLSDPDEQVVLAAVRALGQIGDPVTVPDLNRLRTHRDKSVRDEAGQIADDLARRGQPPGK